MILLIIGSTLCMCTVDSSNLACERKQPYELPVLMSELYIPASVLEPQTIQHEDPQRAATSPRISGFIPYAVREKKHMKKQFLSVDLQRQNG